jgi:hypothetical protein
MEKVILKGLTAVGKMQWTEDKVREYFINYYK